MHAANASPPTCSTRPPNASPKASAATKKDCRRKVPVSRRTSRFARKCANSKALGRPPRRCVDCHRPTFDDARREPCRARRRFPVRACRRCRRRAVAGARRRGMRWSAPSFHTRCSPSRHETKAVRRVGKTRLKCAWPASGRGGGRCIAAAGNDTGRTRRPVGVVAQATAACRGSRAAAEAISDLLPRAARRSRPGRAVR